MSDKKDENKEENLLKVKRDYEETAKEYIVKQTNKDKITENEDELSEKTVTDGYKKSPSLSIIELSTTSIQDNNIYFDSLNSLEREQLQAKLQGELIEAETFMNKCCCGLFCGWLKNSFEPETSKPAPSVLTENMEFLTQEMKENEELIENRFFFQGDREESVEDYLEMIKKVKPVDYNIVDIYSLAVACKIYIKKHIKFISDELYEKTVDNYKNNDFIYVTERLPFLMYQRTLLKYIFEIARMQRSEESVKKWAKVVFVKNEEASENEQINEGIFKNLLTTEFDIVDKKFYE
ncbi:hypothetical protein NUSPORA_00288 [Nucleospora cyclopteri]